MKFHFGIMCDEVRREDNGKLLLIGVYGSTIIAESLPATLVLSLVINVDAEGAKEAPAEFRIMLDDATLKAGKGLLRFTSADPQFLTVRSIPLENIASEGTLSFQIRLEGNDWITAASLPFTAKKPAANASA
jgi:hypothetical protein